MKHVERMTGNERCIKVVVQKREGAGLVWRYIPGIIIDIREKLGVLQWGINASKQMGHVNGSCQHASTVLTR